MQLVTECANMKKSIYLNKVYIEWKCKLTKKRLKTEQIEQ